MMRKSKRKQTIFDMGWVNAVAGDSWKFSYKPQRRMGELYAQGTFSGRTVFLGHFSTMLGARDYVRFLREDPRALARVLVKRTRAEVVLGGRAKAAHRGSNAGLFS